MRKTQAVIQKYYEACLEKYGDDHRGADSSTTLLDFGCGAVEKSKRHGKESIIFEDLDGLSFSDKVNNGKNSYGVKGQNSQYASFNSAIF